MKIYSLRPIPALEGKVKQFLEDNYVSIGYPGIGDLEGADRHEIETRLADGGFAERGREAAEIDLFVNGVQDGDYVLLENGDTVMIGDVGDYFYVESSDTGEDGTCHRRGVTWLRRIPRSELNDLVQGTLDAPGLLKLFAYPSQLAQLDRWLAPQLENKPSDGDLPQVDRETIAEALAVLKAALRSDNPDRRERAAVAILRYAKSD
ncbi:hypothetical protein [Cohnella phaseoli]|uniref:Uncharacterized protein n=1 Tax=Cohnella phaseoli TaxID=456490 RepID=A0A3D9IW67_9BACL|nr:hypothetical protein [Cohnella phaseoli]RED65376.1 hypothetical protein DFP98_1197 [Cohnella phaseoli]